MIRVETLNNKIKNISKGVVISLITTIILLLIFSILLTYTKLSEKTIMPVIIVSTAISIFLGSSIGNSKIKKNGIVNGAIIGGSYILLLYIISSLLNWKFGLNIYSFIMIGIGIVFGIIGGIMGVNLRH